MTDQQKEAPEDLAWGDGKPTDAQYTKLWLYLEGVGQKPTVRKMVAELAARGYTTSPASSQRFAKRLGLSEKAKKSETAPAEKRIRNRARTAKPLTEEALAQDTGKTPQQVQSTLLERMKQLLDDKNSSTHLAITQNRTLMAFNIALMEFYANEPSLLINLKDVSAVLDSLTVGSKLFGGASIDITLPKPGEELPDGVSPTGNTMKTINNLANVDEGMVLDFKEFVAKFDGSRA